MNCPKCGEPMERGFVAAGSSAMRSPTRFEWSGTKPRFVSVGGTPLTGFGYPGSLEAFRCMKCRTLVVGY
jgi:hypothetical protein